MSVVIRVARLDELPPGQGKLVHIGAREIAVYNLEGRYYTTAPFRGHAQPAGVCSCPPGGHRFDAMAEDSPARLNCARRAASIEGEFVVVRLDED